MTAGESPPQSSANEDTGGATEALPDHLIALCDGWSLWRTTCLRGAGFPVTRLTPLIADDTDQALERLLADSETRDAMLTNARDLCRTRIRSLEGEARRPWRRVLRRLEKGAVPVELPGDGEFEAALAAATAACAAVARAHENYVAAFERDTLSTSRALREAANEPRLREAVTWQNRHAVKTGLDSLLRRPVEQRNSQTRQHELLVARYLQRYAATNESIGFFGPIGWGTFADAGAAIDLRPGPALLAARELRFEYWVIDALVDALLRDADGRAELAPRLAPNARIEDSVLHGSLGRRTSLQPTQLHLLQSLDGKIVPRELAAQLGTNVTSLLSVLDRLARAGVIVWRPPIPVDEYPEHALRACLVHIGEARVRERFTHSLDRLLAARRDVGDAAGDPVALDTALEKLETEFHLITDSAPRRNEGKAYAGRTLVYEDCRRNAALSLGPEVLSRLGPPLALILHSARWFTWQFAQQYMEFVAATLQRCQQETGRSVIDLEHLWARLQSESDIVRLIVADVAEQLEEHWTPLLAAPANESTVLLSAEDIRARIHTAFAAPHPGWPGARYHSPDVLIAADSVEAVRDGRYFFVLGEVHIAGNSLAQNLFLNMHPTSGELLGALEVDQPETELVPVYRRLRPGHRMVHDPHTEHGFHITFDDSASWRQPERVLPISTLVIEEAAEGLLVRTRDHSHRFPASAFFGPQMSGLCVNHFTLAGSGPHTPRVTIDDLVVCREGWRFPLRELEFVKHRPAADRYIEVQRWARSHGLPRRFFTRIPGEKKPIYVDLKSLVSVELFAKMVRGAAAEPDAEISVTEMLPTPEQTWLTDAEGNRYTSELRIAALDPAHG